MKLYVGNLPWSIDDGRNVSKAYRDLEFTEEEDIGSGIGAIGILTKEEIIRADLTEMAIRAALPRFKNPELYSRR